MVSGITEQVKVAQFHGNSGTQDGYEGTDSRDQQSGCKINVEPAQVGVVRLGMSAWRQAADSYSRFAHLHRQLLTGYTLKSGRRSKPCCVGPEQSQSTTPQRIHTTPHRIQQASSAREVYNRGILEQLSAKFRSYVRLFVAFQSLVFKESKQQPLIGAENSMTLSNLSTLPQYFGRDTSMSSDELQARAHKSHDGLTRHREGSSRQTARSPHPILFHFRM